MNKFNGYMNEIKQYITKHSPEILTGLGIASMVTSTVLAVKATPKAVKLLQEQKHQLTTLETVQTVWKEYIPAVSFGLGGIVCLVSSCYINNKRSAALATAYAISDTTFRTYRDKIVETIGEKKEKKIRDEIAQDNVNKTNNENRQIIVTPNGQTLCLDKISGRYFRSDLDTIRKAINNLNKEMLSENYISLNRFYSVLGLDGIKDGDYIGWNIDRGFIELDFDACITDTDEPCIVIDYNIMPRDDYNKFV